MMIWSISVVNSGSHDCKILLDCQGGRVGKYSVCGTPSWRSSIHAARSKTELEWGARCKYDKTQKILLFHMKMKKYSCLFALLKIVPN